MILYAYSVYAFCTLCLFWASNIVILHKSSHFIYICPYSIFKIFFSTAEKGGPLKSAL